MREIRIMFTGVGRRVELLQAFREAALGLGVGLKLYGADMTGTVPALAYCDYSRRVCGMLEEGYVDELLALCEADGINLLVPTIDTDLLALSRSVERFVEVGTRVLVSAPEKVALCRDKNLTAGFFESCGLHAPATYHDFREYPGPYPCFIKPKDGSSSINAFKVADAGELAMYAGMVEGYVIQPFVEGVEYTADVFCDFEGHPVHITPRVREAVRAGEVLRTRIALDERIIGEVRRLVEGFRPVGPMTVQLIRDADTGEDFFIEINPRFGGGAPLSMKAGARSVETLLRLLLGEEVSYQPGQCDGAVYARFDQSACVRSGDDRHALRGVVFDLDDTLYPEREYVESGFRAVAELLGEPAIAGEIAAAFGRGEPAIDAALGARGMLGRKQECLRVYREHKPGIALFDGVRELLADLRARGVHVGLITDGRPEGQRAKLDALGLLPLVDDVIITDELGGPQFRKPCDIAFRIMQRRWAIPFEQMAYVGDNAAKDFQAPRQLGMRCVWFDNAGGLYHTSDADAPALATRVGTVGDMADELRRMAGALKCDPSVVEHQAQTQAVDSFD